MPRRLLPLLALLLLVGSGCSVCRRAYQVAYAEPKRYSSRFDRKISMAAYRSLAERVWAETGGVCPDGFAAADYAWGFREGFAQYVFAGGDGEPPAVPPRPYWQTDLRSPEGKAMVQSWFAGYREGARRARDGGYREGVTLQVSASLNDDCCCETLAGGYEGPLGATPYETPAILPIEPTLAPEAPEELGPELVPLPPAEGNEAPPAPTPGPAEPAVDDRVTFAVPAVAPASADDDQSMLAIWRTELPEPAPTPVDPPRSLPPTVLNEAAAGTPIEPCKRLFDAAGGMFPILR